MDLFFDRNVFRTWAEFWDNLGQQTGRGPGYFCAASDCSGRNFLTSFRLGLNALGTWAKVCVQAYRLLSIIFLQLNGRTFNSAKWLLLLYGPKILWGFVYSKKISAKWVLQLKIIFGIGKCSYNTV